MSARNPGIALLCAQGHLDHILSKNKGIGGIALYHHSFGKLNDEDLIQGSPLVLNKLLYLTGGLAASLGFSCVML